MKTKTVCAAVVGAVTGMAALSASAALSARSYILDGLIGHWDGIENVSYGEPHDQTATLWKDLTGSGADFAIPDAYSWDVKGLNVVRSTESHTPYGNTALPYYNAFNGQCYSCEIVYDKPNETVAQTIDYPGEKYVVLLGFYYASKYFFGLDDEIYVGANVAGTAGREKGLMDNYKKAVSDNKGRHLLSVVHDGADLTIRFDGDATIKTVPVATEPVLTRTTRSLHLNRNYGSWDTGLDGMTQTIRFYNRPLTEDETKINRAVDSLRYFGATVAEGNAILPDGWRFAETAGDVKLERRCHARVFENRGGTVEVVGSAAVDTTEYWVEKEVPTTVTLRATPANGYAFLCWRGLSDGSKKNLAEVTDALEGGVTAVFYRVGEGAKALTAKSYVRDGLIGHWDGIENVAYGAAHDNSATAGWKDLTGTGADFASQTAFTWTDKGWQVVRTGRSYSANKAHKVFAAYNDGVYTCEMAYDKDGETPLSLTPPDKKYAVIFGFYYVGHYWFGLDGETSAGFHPNYDGYGGSPNGLASYVVSAADNKGKHVLSCAQNGATATVRFDQLTPTVKENPANPVKRLTRNEIMLCLNRNYETYDTGLNGTVHALRFYDRAISADEYAVNCALDEVRFFGADPADCTLPEDHRFNLSDGLCLERRHTVSVNDAAMGAVRVGDGAAGASVDCWVDRATDTVTLTATPAKDHKFVRWEGAIAGADLKAATGTFTVTGDVTAVFKEIKGLMVIVK